MAQLHGPCCSNVTDKPSPRLQCTSHFSSSHSTRVLGLISAIAACPAIVGTTEAVRHGQRANARERHRGEKCNLVVELPIKNAYSSLLDGALVVLKDGKLYIQHAESSLGRVHPFAGYYLPYPDNQVKWKTDGWKGEGLVSTINEDNHLNWVYVDRETHEVRYGVKSVAMSHLTGPWDCTAVDKRMTFEGWEGFVAVQEDDGEWALYFDRDDDGLQGEGLIGSQGPRRMLEVQLQRRERPKEHETAIDERVERIQEMREKAKQAEEADVDRTWT